MMTEAFLAYKDSVTHYLQDFIRGLQRHAYKIEGVLATISEAIVSTFLANVLRDQAARPQLDEPITPEEQQARLQQEWQSMVRWFVGDNGEPSDVYFLEQTTKDTIARIVRNALRIGVDDKGTDNADISMWQAGPNIRELHSRSRKRLKDSGTGSIKDQRERKQRARSDFLKARQEEEKMLQAYLEKEEIIISQLDKVSAKERYFLLYWIGRCMANKSRQVLTPEGIRISLAMAPDRGRARLVCEDGELDMPDYSLKFDKGIRGAV